jgi:hypothetical protein
MRILQIAILSTFALFEPLTMAAPVLDTVNGNLVREPVLQDYQKAERSPGFSKITDIIDENEKPLAE